MDAIDALSKAEISVEIGAEVNAEVLLQSAPDALPNAVPTTTLPPTVTTPGIYGDRLTCAVETTLDIIGGRWKVLILHELFQGVRRFNELHRALHGITQKMLTQQLRELQEHGIIHREVYLQVPPKVEYSLTDLGRSLEPILDAMHHWGVRYQESLRAQGESDR
ncbi:MAG TPA: helix-turn-helix domain-containing protein [Chroococcidiopsis sp.]